MCGTSRTTPPRNWAGKLLQLPPPPRIHRTSSTTSPPLEIGPENSFNYPPPSNSRNFIDYLFRLRSWWNALERCLESVPTVKNSHFNHWCEGMDSGLHRKLGNAGINSWAAGVSRILLFTRGRKNWYSSPYRNILLVDYLWSSVDKRQFEEQDRGRTSERRQANVGRDQTSKQTRQAPPNTPHITRGICGSVSCKQQIYILQQNM